MAPNACPAGRAGLTRAHARKRHREIQDFGSFRYNGNLIPRDPHDAVTRDRISSHLRERSMQLKKAGHWATRS